MLKNIYRTNKNRVIAGVCGGIANYYSIDVAPLRIGLIILLFLSRLILPSLFFIISILYIIAWILMPLRNN